MDTFDRDQSSSLDWEDTRSQSSQRSDLTSGYHSAGGPMDGNYHPGYASSLRSVGSVGSQGSGGGGEGRHPRFGPAAVHLMNGETQFPPSMYHAASDAAKSDAATVCSGSVVEDIEEDSIMSTGDMHNSSMKNHPSPPSSVKMAFGSAGLKRSNSAGNRLVDYADRSQEMLDAVIPQQRAAFLPAAPTMRADEQDMGIHYNNMGPPLSRSLSLHGGSSSRAGSVKSFESTAGSDVVAHVDPDDCGGSITDVQSIHSQEDANASSMEKDIDSTPAFSKEDDSKPAATMNGEDSSSPPSPHPLLCDASNPSNGRISPGGTIYKGRGVRRYQGRYMHLPLKRFHQNGVHPQSVQGNSGGSDGAGYQHPNYYGDNDQWEARYDPGYNDAWERDSMLNQRLDGGSPPYNDWNNRDSPSRKRSRSRSRSRDRVPENNGRVPDVYDNDRMRGRSPGTSGRNHRSRGRNGYHRHGGGRNGYRGGGGFGGRPGPRGEYRERGNRSFRGGRGGGGRDGGRSREDYSAGGFRGSNKHRRR